MREVFQDSRDCDRAKILVVDDVSANVKAIEDILTTAGYLVTSATSGKCAIAQIECDRPDLILLGIQTPETKGFETCAQIKSNLGISTVPIIFMAAFSNLESLVREFALGAVDYISKPFQASELLARIETHLQHQKLMQLLEQQVEARTVELQQTLEALDASKLQQIQAEKMAALGSLMSGVAHEINNPIAFIDGSIRNAKDHVEELLDHISLYRQEYPYPTKAIVEDAEEINLNFLYEDLPKILLSMETATSRVKAISSSIRAFARADIEQKVEADLHENLDGTLLILKYRLNGDEHRPAIKVVKNYSPLPLCNCFPGQLGQVFMNILANAIDAFDEVAQTSSFEKLKVCPQVITIQTTDLAEREAVEICIRDNGKGMPAQVKDRVFEKLFTTKKAGVGTGLGLAIAQEIISQNHNGELTLTSAPGRGTAFFIRLPYG